MLKKTRLYKWYLNNKIEKQYTIEREINQKRRGPLISQYLKPNGIGAELGVLQGNFSRVLFECSKAKELHLIDAWYFLDKKWAWTDGNQSTIDAVIKILQENRFEIENRKMFVHVQDDIKILSYFDDDFFDWVYIDSSHTYEHTAKELEILKRKVKLGEIICGDDWNPDANHRHYGVCKAVSEFILKEKYELLYANAENLQWFIKKHDNIIMF